MWKIIAVRWLSGGALDPTWPVCSGLKHQSKLAWTLKNCLTDAIIRHENIWEPDLTNSLIIGRLFFILFPDVTRVELKSKQKPWKMSLRARPQLKLKLMPTPMKGFRRIADVHELCRFSRHKNSTWLEFLEHCGFEYWPQLEYWVIVVVELLDCVLQHCVGRECSVSPSIGKVCTLWHCTRSLKYLLLLLLLCMAIACFQSTLAAVVAVVVVMLCGRTSWL